MFKVIVKIRVLASLFRTIYTSRHNRSIIILMLSLLFLRFTDTIFTFDVTFLQQYTWPVKSDDLHYIDTANVQHTVIRKKYYPFNFYFSSRPFPLADLRTNILSLRPLQSSCPPSFLNHLRHRAPFYSARYPWVYCE